MKKVKCKDATRYSNLKNNKIYIVLDESSDRYKVEVKDYWGKKYKRWYKKYRFNVVYNSEQKEKTTTKTPTVNDTQVVFKQNSTGIGIRNEDIIKLFLGMPEDQQLLIADRISDTLKLKLIKKILKE